MSREDVRIRSLVKMIKAESSNTKSDVLRIEQSWDFSGHHGCGRAGNNVILENQRPIFIGYSQGRAKRIAKELGVKWIPDDEYQDCLSVRR